MSDLATAQQLLKESRLEEAVEAAKTAIRKTPGDVQLRVLYFQLCSLKGDWKRAAQQLETVASLDKALAFMEPIYTKIFEAEIARTAVFKGRIQPIVWGEGSNWIALMLQAIKLASEGEYAAAADKQAAALDEAEPVAGKLNDEPFAFLMDQDSRLGPVVEAIMMGKYYWIPQSNISSITIDEPAAIHDTIWVKAEFRWHPDGGGHGMIPVRYPMLTDDWDVQHTLGRMTSWDEATEDYWLGKGQRTYATDSADHALLETRTITFDHE